jgi:hypothetical protein
MVMAKCTVTPVPGQTDGVPYVEPRSTITIGHSPALLLWGPHEDLPNQQIASNVDTGFERRGCTMTLRWATFGTTNPSDSSFSVDPIGSTSCGAVQHKTKFSLPATPDAVSPHHGIIIIIFAFVTAVLVVSKHDQRTATTTTTGEGRGGRTVAASLLLADDHDGGG